MVVEEDRANAVLRAVADEYARKIIASTMSSEKSVEDISDETGIPKSSCYRRVHELLGLRLLRPKKIVITSTGKKYETFRSTRKDAKIGLSSTGELFVDVTLSHAEEKLHNLWQLTKGNKPAKDQPEHNVN